MGEVAEMMLDGTLCSSCGAYIGEGENGYATMCASCAEENDYEEAPPRSEKVKVPCKICGKKVSQQGLVQHMNDSHGHRETIKFKELLEDWFVLFAEPDKADVAAVKTLMEKTAKALRVRQWQAQMDSK